MFAPGSALTALYIAPDYPQKLPCFSVVSGQVQNFISYHNCANVLRFAVDFMLTGDIDGLSYRTQGGLKSA